jgi:hypothetical protein
MKKLFVILAFAGLVFTSCTDNNSVEPVPNDNQLIEGSVKLIEIPEITDLRLMKNISASKIIKSNEGGTLNLEYENSYSLLENQIVVFKLKGELKVPSYAFNESELLFEMTMSDKYALTSFSPSPKSFLQPLEITIEYEGIDLTNIDFNTLSFIHLNTTGRFERVPFDEIEVVKGSLVMKKDSDGKITISGIDDYSTNKVSKLTVKKALTDHFSRFGFVQ